MAARSPLVIVNGQVQQLQAGDTVTGATASDPAVGSFAPGAFSLAAGQYACVVSHLQLTSAQRVTLAGTGRLYVNG